MSMFLSCAIFRSYRIAMKKTGLPDDHFTHVLTNFGMMLFPNPAAAMSGL
jgi:hypothetical protein